MGISLNPKQEALVKRFVDDGLFDAPDQVIEAALDLLAGRAQATEAQIDRLNREIETGMEQLRAGDVVDAEQAFSELREKSRRRRGGTPCGPPS